tara:strand:+ start:1830 stop:3161 length:1332 start_codon:yes stop_codon:yes gene_type:complete
MSYKKSIFIYPKKYEEILAYISIFLISLNNTLTYKQILGISIDRFLEIILFFLIFPFFKEYFFKYRAFLYFFLTVLILCFFKLLILFFDDSNLSGDFESAARDLVRVFFFFIIFCLAFYAIKILDLMAIKAYLIFTAPYFLLAFMQSPITPFNEFSFQIWSLFYESQLLVENWYAEFLYRDYNRFHFLVRVIGPYGSPTALCYALIPPIIFSAFLYLQEKKIKYYVWFIFLSSVAFLTLTRSLLLGTVLMILYLAFMQIYLRRDRWVVISQSIIVLATIPFLLTEFSELADFGRLVDLTDVFSGGSSRIIAWTSGFIALIENPFYFSAENNYLPLFNEACVRSKNCSDVISLHNGFLRIGRDFSIFGLALTLILFSHLIYCSLNQRIFFKSFYIFSFLIFFIHTFFHNNTIFISEYTILIFFAFTYIFTYSKKISLTESIVHN